MLNCCRAVKFAGFLECLFAPRKHENLLILNSLLSSIGCGSAAGRAAHYGHPGEKGRAVRAFRDSKARASVASVGFSRSDFATFRIEGFDERMAEIYARVRPRLVKLGELLAPELARRLHLEFFPHVAKHARRTVNPPPETWAAFGPSARGYKRYGYLALCVSSAGLHARAVVKPEADHRGEMARALEKRASELARSFKGAPLARYEKWDFAHLPAPARPSEELFADLAQKLGRKVGGLDVGFGWNKEQAARLDRGELIDAFAELEPLYRLIRAAA